MTISVLNIHIRGEYTSSTHPERHLKGLHRLRICEVDSLETVEV